ncbi:hypothetical protein AAHA92_32435 [Salvia divinorum]|uniref:Uncharacterized protein n=1 Tax=Salvia divinorum TaxID=28513 RepID=A0ABD1FNV0_SALDI
MDNQDQGNKLEDLRSSQNSTRGEGASHFDSLEDQEGINVKIREGSPRDQHSVALYKETTNMKKGVPTSHSKLSTSMSGGGGFSIVV